MLFRHSITTTDRLVHAALAICTLVTLSLGEDARAQPYRLHISDADAAVSDVPLFSHSTLYSNPLDTVTLADAGTARGLNGRSLAVANHKDPALVAEGGAVRITHVPTSGISSPNPSDVTIHGTDTWAHFGRDMDAGDVNGDGWDDLLIAAPSGGQGTVYLFFGYPGWSGAYTADDADLEIQGTPSTFRFGHTVAVIADVDGDNASEILVVARGAGSLGATSAVRVFFSTTIMAHMANSVGSPAPLLASSADVTLRGAPTTYQLFKTSVDDGDIDGDGAVDLVIGDPNPMNTSDAGRVYVVSDVGSLQGYDGPLTVVSSAILQGTAPGDEAGHTVAIVGDMNHDGFDDLFVGAPGRDQARGVVYYVQGASAFNHTTLAGQARLILAGEQAGDFLGQTLAPAGDPTADDRVDVLVGAPGNAACCVSCTGKVYLLAGRPDTDLPAPGATVSIAAPAEAIFNGVPNVATSVGQSDLLGADYSGDGIDDIVIGVQWRRHVGPPNYWTVAAAAAVYFP